MAKIIFNKPEETNGALAIGDWIIISREDASDSLCVVAQTEGGHAQLVAIGDNDANRYSTPYPMLSRFCIGVDCLKHITYGHKWRKVNVTITVE